MANAHPAATRAKRLQMQLPVLKLIPHVIHAEVILNIMSPAWSSSDLVASLASQKPPPLCAQDPSKQTL
eukprot:6286176-Amphidinium_carterae.1